MNIVLIGGPGAGKGTQAAAMAEEFGLRHIASGDMFREATARKTLRGREAKAYVDRGELVPDDLTVAMVMDRLAQADCVDGVVLDGFPRNLAQAQALDRALEAHSKRVDHVIYLAVRGDELLHRLSGRWLCRKCQASYHEVLNPPRQAGRCDACGGDLYQREDDTVETVRRRLEVYFEQTAPVIEYYRQQEVLDEINGERTIPEVRQSILDAVRRRKQGI